MADFNPKSYDLVAAMEKKHNQQRRKKSGGFGIFRAALHMLRKRTDEKDAAAMKKKTVERERNNGDWRKIVGSMRPLHVQETPASPIYAMSPVSYASPAECSSAATSRYASATNLRDLCNSDDELDEEQRDPDEVFDAITGDEEIDAKAEEFIAQFYKQIEHQNSLHRQNRGI